MRWSLLLLLMTGCVTEEPQDFVPLISICTALQDDIPDTPDEPDVPGECANCGGLGYVGDGRVKVDCPECETPWRAGESNITGDAAELVTSIYFQHMAEVNAFWEKNLNLTSIGEATIGWMAWKLEQPCEIAATEAGPATDESTGRNSSWKMEFDEARSAARDRAVPLVVIWTRPNCPPCERLKQAMEATEVMDGMRSFATSVVDMADRPDLVRQYGIQRFPFMTATFRGETLFYGVPSVTEQGVLSELTELAQRAGVPWQGEKIE